MNTLISTTAEQMKRPESKEYIAHILSPTDGASCLVAVVPFRAWIFAEEGEVENLRSNTSALEVLLEEHRERDTHLFYAMNFCGANLRSAPANAVSLRDFSIRPAPEDFLSTPPSADGKPWWIEGLLDFSDLDFDGVRARSFVLMMSISLNGKRSQSEGVRFSVLPPLGRSSVFAGLDYPSTRRLESPFLCLDGWALRLGEKLERAECFAGEQSLGEAMTALASPEQTDALPYVEESKQCRFSLMVDREKLKNTTLGESLLRDTFPLRVEIRFCSGEKATVLGPQFSWEAGPIVLPQLILGELEGIRVIDEGLIEVSGWVLPCELCLPSLFLEGRSWRLELTEICWTNRGDIIERFPTVAGNGSYGFTAKFHPSALGESPGVISLAAETKSARIELCSTPQAMELTRQVEQGLAGKQVPLKMFASRLLSQLGAKKQFAKPRRVTKAKQFPKRILFATHNMSLVEGAPRVLSEIIRSLSADKAQATDLLVVSPHDGPMRQVLEALGVTVLIEPDLRAHEQTWLGYQRGLSHVHPRLESFAPEYVFANVIDSFWAADWAKRNGVPVFWLFHESVDPLRWFTNLEPKLRLLFLDRLQRAEKLGFVSEATRKLFLSLVPTEQTVVIPNGIDLEGSQQLQQRWTKSRARNELSLGTEFVITLIGTTTRRKGQDRFLLGLAELRALAPELQFTAFIVGARENEFLTELKASLAELQLQDLVRIVPETPEVSPYYAATDVVVIASREESAPLVSLEAFAWERPLVSTNVFGLAEQLSDRENALVFDGDSPRSLAQALIAVHEDTALRDRLIKAGTRALKERFSLSHMLSQYRALISQG